MENIASWVAPVATSLAALITASNLGARITGYGFAIFTVGSLAWLALGWSTGQSNLVWQNALLTLLNLFGIWSWLFRKARNDDGARAAQEESAFEPTETLFPASALGAAPLLSGGEPYGRCVDAMIGGASGRIAYVVVARGGVAGVGERLLRIEWDQLRLDGEAFRSRLSPDALASAPEVDREAWPAR